MGKINLIIGRIEQQNTDIIVNSTNTFMSWEETTVNGDIHNAAGFEFTKECEEYVKKHGELKTNDIVIMKGYNLLARYVLNVFPPFYEMNKTPQQNYDKLIKCYRKCFEKIIMFNKQMSVTFPLLGAGTFMYPYRVSFASFIIAAQECEKELKEIRMTFLDREKLLDCRELWENANYAKEM